MSYLKNEKKKPREKIYLPVVYFLLHMKENMLATLVYKSGLHAAENGKVLRKIEGKILSTSISSDNIKPCMESKGIQLIKFVNSKVEILMVTFCTRLVLLVCRTTAVL